MCVCACVYTFYFLEFLKMITVSNFSYNFNNNNNVDCIYQSVTVIVALQGNTFIEPVLGSIHSFKSENPLNSKTGALDLFNLP